MAHHQLRQQADAQPLGYHGQNGAVLSCGVLHVGPHAHLVKGRPDLVVLALLQLDERLLRQCLCREGVRPGVGVVAGDDDLQLVPVQRVGLQALHRGQSQKAAVHRTLQDPLLHLLVEVAGDHVKLDAGVLSAKALENGRQPLGRHAGEGGDLDKTGIHAPQAGCRLHQRVVGGAQLFDLRQQRPAIRCQHYAAPIAAQQRDAQFLLQRLHRVADTGLGEVQRLRRLGEVAAGRRLQEHLIFGYAHALTSFLSLFYHTFTHSCKYNNAFYK